MVEGEYIPANEPEYSPTNEDAQLPAEMNSYIEKTVHDSFSSLREKGFQVRGSYPEGKEELLISGGWYNLDYDDPKTLQLLELLHKKWGGVLRTIENKLAYARLSQHDPGAWLDYKVEEYNIDGLIDDDQFEIEVERVQETREMMRPEPILHNQCEYLKLKQELAEREEAYMRERAAENRKRFFAKAKRLETRARKQRAHAARTARRKARHEQARYYYDLLYRVRKVNKPWNTNPEYFAELLEEALSKPVTRAESARDRYYNWLVERRLSRITGANRWKVDQINDKVVMNGLVFGMKIPRTGGIESETPDEIVEFNREHVRTTRRRENLKYDRKMVFEDLVVPESVQVPTEKPIRAPSSGGTVYSTKGITRIHGGDYKTPLGKLWKKYITEFGGPPPRRYETEVKKHETVEETEHRDQQVGPGAYKPAERRRHPSKAARYAENRAQRMSRLVA